MESVEQVHAGERTSPGPRGRRAGSSSSVVFRRRVKAEVQVLEMVVAMVPCDPITVLLVPGPGTAGRQTRTMCAARKVTCAAKLDVSVSSRSSKPWRYLVASWPVLGPCYGKRLADHPVNYTKLTDTPKV